MINNIKTGERLYVGDTVKHKHIQGKKSLIGYFNGKRIYLYGGYSKDKIGYFKLANKFIVHKCNRCQMLLIEKIKTNENNPH